MQKLVYAVLTTAAVALATPALAQSLKGSPASMTRQNQEADGQVEDQRVRPPGQQRQPWRIGRVDAE